MSKMRKMSILLAGGLCAMAHSQNVQIQVDVAAGKKPISPYIYGKNHGLSTKVGTATSADTLQRYQDAGFKILRLNDGNNATKYHFRKKLTSHPDWYNNVYDRDWDQDAKEMQAKMPGVQGLFAISLLGWAANNKDHNFDDWLYNGGQWWQDGTTAGPSYDWAGTTPITAAAQKPAGTYDPLSYLEKWPSDSSVKILDHWFGNEPGSLGLNASQFRYWNMDNEPDIWNGTHSDVMPDTMSAEEFVQIYVKGAKQARAKYPDIKLVGPVATNEWQWFYWHNKLVPTQIAGRDTTLPFVEFFAKRVAEEQQAAGVRLLDVFDYHFYPDLNAAGDKNTIAQLHRIWFDKNYKYPKANAIKNAFAGETKEYIFERTRTWLNTYFGANHGITLGITECGNIDAVKTDPSLAAVWYASHLGVFANAGDVEVFTPWNQYDGMFETIHLFTRYAKSNSVSASSSLDSLVSAYASLNDAGDSMTVILVNRDLQGARTATVNLSGFAHGGTWAPTFRLADLVGETFKSKTQNALYANGVTISQNAFTLALPKASVQAVVLSTQNPGTMPTFSSSSAPSSSSSSSASGTVVWDYQTGAQVKQPNGTLGGWWYNYKDPLSTISAVTAADITAQKALHVVFTGVQSADQAYNYAGVGFNWGNTAKGQAIATVDLSKFNKVCVDYISTAGIQAGIGQPSTADAKTQVNFMTDGAALPAATTRTTQCVPFTAFVVPTGETLKLAKQSAFQLQVAETAEFTVYRIMLSGTTSRLVQTGLASGSLQARVSGSAIHLEAPAQARSARLLDLQGHPVQQWNLDGSAHTQTLALQNVTAGRYFVVVPGVGYAPVLILP